MATTLPQRDEDHSSLPQYGFGTCADFDILVKSNHFLFRVYTPRERSPFFDDTDPFFIAPKFNERYNRSPLELSHDSIVQHRGTYDDVVKHMDWTSRSSSSFISTSFSFIWSIWEALRRYHLGVKKDIQIAVINASAVSGRAATATELLHKSDPSERRNKYWKRYRFAQESQCVLVYELIPATAVLASIPLLSLLEKLPSYFLQLNVPHPLKENSLAVVAWKYAERKESYRQFCQNMSTRFLQLSPEVRLQDTTAGSVRLALAFLRPWFHRCAVEDFQTATVTLCALAFSIAQWPGQWWAQEHAEIWKLIRAMVLSVAEEIRAKQQDGVVEVTRLQEMIAELKELQEAEQRQAAANANKLQGDIIELEVARKREQIHLSAETDRLRSTVSELKEAVKKYETELSSRATRKPAHSLTPLIIVPPLWHASAISPSPFVPAPPSTISLNHLRKIPTPITPPTSPIHSTAPTFLIETSNLPDTGSSPTTETSGLPSPIESRPPSPTIQIPPSPAQSSLGEEGLPTRPSSPTEKPFISLILPHPPVIPSNKASSSSELSLTVEPPAEAIPPFPAEEPLYLEFNDIFIPDYVPSIPFRISSRETRRVRASSALAETASCVVTGFLVGAFITLCLLSPQRRTLMTGLT